ncbi:WhiB family transcriptional regulator [Pseudonocardia sp. RS11V-5]|uniref:WhiB family transcriptional regulator n=1 Tax=Pseudonocardia terrae TaxID=2905831 RepID=UPI001E5F7841|nr:WhiB family transcriptional regulator [Pseudonocardia terrae]MCE3550701.1 WhiB family transcriptional regulator [Pseudonocardia terrae]
MPTSATVPLRSAPVDIRRRRRAARVQAGLALPCQHADPDLWFAVSPVDLERAKGLCRPCPVRAECLTGAVRRGEPWGVWGGEIIDRGTVITHKRGPGRPPRSALADSG